MFKNRFKTLAIIFTALFSVTILASEAAAENSQKSTQSSNKSAQSGKKGAKKASGKADEKKADDFETSLKKMREAYFQNQYASALVYCENAIRSMPSDIELSQQVTVLMIGMELYDRNEKFEEALALSNKISAITADPKILNSVCFNQATTLTKMHRWADARNKYSECPGNSDQEKAIVESNVAELWMIEGDSESAARGYKQSLEHYSTNPHALYGLAIALSRLHRWDEANKAFLDGLAIDPSFSFLKDAFFEPVCENDYQKGFRLYELGRYRDARFYFERYIKAEERSDYRKTAQELLNRITDNSGPLVGTYPVLAGNVRSIASTQNGKKIVFADFERESTDKYKSVIWVLNTETEKVIKRAELEGQIVVDMAFVNDSTIRILGNRKRFEMNIDEPDSGYYLYDNCPDAYALELGQNGSEIHAVTADGKLTVSQWFNPWELTSITEIPLETKRLRMSTDHQSMMIVTTLKTLMVDIEKDRLNEMLPAQFDVSSTAVHPNKKVFALGIQSGAIIVNESGEIKRIYGSAGSTDNLAFDTSGNYLAVQSGQTLEIWNVSEL